MPDLTIGEIKRLLQGLCPGLIHELVPNCRKEGNLLSAPNPTRSADKPGSFKIWPNGKWREFDEAYEVGSGDIINLVAYVQGYAPKSTEGRRFALNWARERLGVKGADRQTIARVKRTASKDAEQRRLIEERDAAREAFRKLLRAKEIWQGAGAFGADDDNVVTRYLAARGVHLDAIADLTPTILRHHARLVHWTEDGKPLFPAMVAPLINLDLGKMTAVHCTFLDPEHPAKADVRSARLMLGAMKGAIVPLTLGRQRLTLAEALERKLQGPVVLCEGIETGLSIAMAIAGEARVWACLNIGNIGVAPIGHACISSVIVAIENDAKPEALRQREGVLDKLEAMGKPISTMRPHVGVDHNDLLRG